MPREATITQKISRKRTGFKGNVFVHVDHDAHGHVTAVRFSEKGKDDNAIDRLLTALGDEVTDIVRQIQGLGGLEE